MQLVDKLNAKRITEDCYIAIDALQAIQTSQNYLHISYLKEKVSIVQSCLDFMKSFYEVDEDD